MICVYPYNCGPKWGKEAMSADMLRQALEAMTIWPRLPQVHLTGGEPFLHFDLLLDEFDELRPQGFYKNL